MKSLFFRYHYKLIREYTWSVKTKSNSGYEENFYFLMKDSGVYYNQLETRLVKFVSSEFFHFISSLLWYSESD
jgi:hypothetical protein